jgi:hypothetical protein
MAEVMIGVDPHKGSHTAAARRYYMRVYQNAAGCRPSTCPALFRGRPPRPSVPGWPQSRRQVRLCAGLQAAASALCAVVAHGV